MTKQDVLAAIKDYTEEFPKEALQEMQANIDSYVPELLESLDFAYRNAEQLAEDDDYYFMHIYAMYFLAEIKEKRAFPLLINLLRLSEDDNDYIFGDELTEIVSRILLCTYDPEKLQLLIDVIEDTELYEFSRSVALEAYGYLVLEGFISKEEAITYLRSLVYKKLSDDDTLVVSSAIKNCVIDIPLFEMFSDVQFLYDNDKLETFLDGDYDDFIDEVFDERASRPRYIDNAVSVLESSYLWKVERDGDEESTSDEADEEIIIEEEPEQIAEPVIEKVGRNAPCPCGSGKKYKDCHLDKERYKTANQKTEVKNNLLEFYPTNSVLFNEMYDSEAIEIDKLVYQALRRRGRLFFKEKVSKKINQAKVNFLKEALHLFIDKCQREQITSFAAYDERYKIHYRSGDWVAALVEMIGKKDSAELLTVRETAAELIERFE